MDNCKTLTSITGPNTDLLDFGCVCLIPTLTSVSRQAILPEPPIILIQYITQTVKRNYGNNSGKVRDQKQEIAYRRSLGDEDIKKSLEAVINPYKRLLRNGHRYS